MSARILSLVSLAFVAFAGLAAEPTTGPFIDGYGAAFAVEDRDVPLVEGHVYRVVYEITDYDGSPTGVNRELDTVARFLNMHGKNGVALENIQLAVVIHGAALVNVLNDASYLTRFEIANPNLDLLHKLMAAGVRFYACGQSMGLRGFAKSELEGGVRMALSAMTMVHQLQADGYTLQP